MPPLSVTLLALVNSVNSVWDCGAELIFSRICLFAVTDSCEGQCVCVCVLASFVLENAFSYNFEVISTTVILYGYCFLCLNFRLASRSSADSRYFARIVPTRYLASWDCYLNRYWANEAAVHYGCCPPNAQQSMSAIACVQQQHNEDLRLQTDAF